jgi:3-oxoacyl-[acyl-carrier protein] reductase
MRGLDLSGRTALVCGASRGIGRACAETLAELGARVFVAARSESDLAGTVAGLPTDAGQAHGHLVIDLGDTDSVRAHACALLERSGPVEILVNNSGGPPAGTATGASPEQFEEAFREHLLAAQVLVQTLQPGMEERGYGRVVNIISTSVKQPIPGLGVSNTIRGAVASWAKTIARELAPFGITVNNVLPGFTDTERLRYFFGQRADAAGVSVEEARRRALAGVPAGRFAAPAEIAAAVAFLASPAAGYVNGINLPVDGGMLGCL